MTIVIKLRGLKWLNRQQNPPQKRGELKARVIVGVLVLRCAWEELMNGVFLPIALQPGGMNTTHSLLPCTCSRGRPLLHNTFSQATSLGAFRPQAESVFSAESTCYSTWPRETFSFPGDENSSISLTHTFRSWCLLQKRPVNDMACATQHRQGDKGWNRSYKACAKQDWEMKASSASVEKVTNIMTKIMDCKWFISDKLV